MALAGRPLGSFGDPVPRMRAWTILCLPQNGVSEPTLKERASLWGVPLSCLQPLRLDGADLAHIVLDGSRSLLEHLEKCGAGSGDVIATYRHPLWRHMLAWYVPEGRHWPAPFHDRQRWLAHQMKRYGILRLDPETEGFATELGLKQRNPAPWDDPPPLQVKCMCSLDGLLTLLLLHREAREALELTTAASLQTALWQVAQQWEKQCNYRGEALDTWRWLLHTRLCDWLPQAAPHARAITVAERQLQDEYPAGKARSGKRNGRRWRRWISMRAGCVQHECNFAEERCVVVFDPALEWVCQNRGSIEAHLNWAQEALEDATPLAPQPAPLVMPPSLMQRRQRPIPSFDEGLVHGDVLPFDIIPVRAGPECNPGDAGRG